jgi:hypothetical protein
MSVIFANMTFLFDIKNKRVSNFIYSFKECDKALFQGGSGNTRMSMMEQPPS